MPPPGAKKTPFDPGIVSRLAGAAVAGIKGAAQAWMGPGEPVTPSVATDADVRGRQYDYPYAVNTVQRPRGEQGAGLDFATLRALAEPAEGGFDLVRIAIDKRKDQMATQEWIVRGRDKSDGGPRARAIEEAMRKPDLVHHFDAWQRMLVEDLLVIDAPCVYLRPTTLGYKLPEVMDGSLIKPLLRVDGRTPLPPEPAFQQNIKGMAACDYTLDELIYQPRNPRSHKNYGQSPVEQVVLTMQIGLRRQVSQLEYYTAGSTPDTLLSAPESWSADQIRIFQEYIDSVLSGNTEERRRMRMVPGGTQPFELKPGQLKDEFDEWLARIVCWCFSLSPQALIRQMNRATSDTAKESAQEEGLEPLKKWWKNLIDDILAKGFDAPDLELAWADEEIVDPVDKANVLSIALGRGGGKAWLTLDEVRAKYGEQPMTPEQEAELKPAPPPALAQGVQDNGEGEDGAQAKPGADAPQTAAEKVRKRVAATARRAL